MGQHEVAGHRGQLDAAGQLISPIISDLGDFHALHEASHVNHLGWVLSCPVSVEETRGEVLHVYSISTTVEHRAVADIPSRQAGDHAIV